MTLPTAPPFYTVRPLPKLEALIEGASNAVPPARPEVADPPDPWTKPPDKGAQLPPPGRDWPAPPPPPPPPPAEEPKKDPPLPPAPDPFYTIRMIPWPGHSETRTLYAVPAPLVPPWNALRCLVELRDERKAGGMPLSSTARWAMRMMEMEFIEEAQKREKG